MAKTASAIMSSAPVRRRSDIVDRHAQLPRARQAPVRIGAKLQAACRRHEWQDGFHLRLRTSRLGVRACLNSRAGSAVDAPQCLGRTPAGPTNSPASPTSTASGRHLGTEDEILGVRTTS